MKHFSATIVVATLAFICSSAAAEGLTPKQDAKKGTWGYVNDQGKWAVKPKFESAAPFETRPDGIRSSEVLEKGLTGYMGTDGKLLGNGVVFEKVEPLSDKAMLVRVKGKYGVATYGCVYIIKPELSSIERIDSDRMLIDLKGKKGIIDNNGNYTVAPVYEAIDLSLPGYLRVTKGGKCGLTDNDGNVLVAPAEFTSIKPFGRYWKVGKGNKTGLYDLNTNTLLVKADYDNVAEPQSVDGETYIPVLKGDKWGAVDSRGKEVLKCRNSKVMPVAEMGLFLIERPGFGYRLWFPREKVFLEMQLTSDRTTGPFRSITGEIDRPQDSYPARIASAVRFDEIGQWVNTLPMRQQVYRTKFASGRFSALLNKNGNLVSSRPGAAINSIGNFYEVTGNGLTDIYDADGNRLLEGIGKKATLKNGWLFCETTVLSPDGSKYNMTTDGTTVFMQDNTRKWHYFDGSCMAETGYDTVEFSDSIAHVCRDGRWGLFKNGRESVACQHPAKLEYSSELKGIIVRQNGLMGLNDIDGNVIVKPEYSSIEPVGEWMRVKKDNKYGILGANGAEVIPALYDNIYSMSDVSNWIIKKNGLEGMVDIRGNVILEPSYIFGKNTGISNHLWVQKNDLWGVCDGDGGWIVPAKYSEYTLNTVEQKYYCATVNGTETYYNSNGNIMEKKRRVYIKNQSLSHNIYDANNNKGLRLNYELDTEFLLEEPIYVEAQIYNANGTPAKNNRGQFIKWGSWATPSYLFAHFADRWFTFPYAQFVQPRGTKRDYYIKIRVKDEGGKEISTFGNDKISFYMTR